MDPPTLRTQYTGFRVVCEIEQALEVLLGESGRAQRKGQALAAPGRKRSTRWLGYGVDSAAEVEQVAAYTNVVWKYGGDDPKGILAAVVG